MQAHLPFRNAILNHLLAEDLGLLEPHLLHIDLPVRHRLADANRPISHAFFLEAGVASTAASVRQDVPIEIGIVGREGVANLPVLVGTDRSPNNTYMQIGGNGLSILADDLRKAMDQSPTLTQVLLRFVHVFMVQTASTVLANGRATIAERLARWLLMARDRVDQDELPLTHEFLAIMLGVRRPGVTAALSEFERRGLIDGKRGVITMLDREGLELAANGYYGIAEAELLRLFGPSSDA
jgi:CRP-like cAMP-binding protein